MTLDRLPDPPVLPPLPEPSGFGWGYAHLDAYRTREHLLAEWAAEVAHLEVMTALDRQAELAEALADRDRRIRALVALDAPTVPIPVVRPVSATGGDEQQQPPRDEEPPDYRHVPAEKLTKPQAASEARRLTHAGYRVKQSGRNLAEVRDDIAAARRMLEGASS